jgi:hypothetical protein
MTGPTRDFNRRFWSTYLEYLELNTLMFIIAAAIELGELVNPIRPAVKHVKRNFYLPWSTLHS